MPVVWVCALVVLFLLPKMFDDVGAGVPMIDDVTDATALIVLKIIEDDKRHDDYAKLARSKWAEYAKLAAECGLDDATWSRYGTFALRLIEETALKGARKEKADKETKRVMINKIRGGKLLASKEGIPALTKEDGDEMMDVLLAVHQSMSSAPATVSGAKRRVGRNKLFNVVSKFTRLFMGGKLHRKLQTDWGKEHRLDKWALCKVRSLRAFRVRGELRTFAARVFRVRGDPRASLSFRGESR